MNISKSYIVLTAVTFFVVGFALCAVIFGLFYNPSPKRIDVYNYDGRTLKTDSLMRR